MAVFLMNICKYSGCGITFPSLGDLIQHIEDTHIDYDPKVIEQKEQAQPACLPLSYVLRFISEDARKESPFLSGNAAGVELKRKLAIKHHSYSMSSSNRSNTPTGSEMDEDEMIVSESEDSNDSWTTEEFSSEFIMRYGSRHSGSGNNGTPGNEKPFACPVPGCKKRYKNVNGIKYHSKNGHKKDGKVRKGYKCHCGKSYKTAQGLKNHAMVAHNSSPESVLTTQQVVNTANASVIQRSASPSQSLGSLSPSSISNMSSSASSCHGGSNNALNGSNNILQHLTANNIGGAASMGSSGITCLTTSANVTAIALQQQQQAQVLQSAQHQQHSFNTNANSHQQLTAVAAATGNSTNLVRSTIGLVSIKANNSSAPVLTKTTAATNLLAASAAANKILKLATNAAAAAAMAAANTTNVEIAQQHKLLDNGCVEVLPRRNSPKMTTDTSRVGTQPAKHQPTQTTATKITLPNLVNLGVNHLGILTPATSPTKTTQTLSFTQQQSQPHQQQPNPNNTSKVSQQRLLDTVHSGSSINNNNSSTTAKNSIFIVESTTQQHPQSHHTTTTTTTTQTQQPPQHHLPLTPISPNSKNNNNNTITTIQQKNVNSITATLQHIKQNIVGSIHLTSVSLANSNSNNNTSNSNNNNSKSSLADGTVAAQTATTATVVSVADAGISVGVANDET